MGEFKGTKGVGVKGKSGRKSAYEEHNKTRAINLLWEKVRIKMEKNEELTEWEEKMIAPILPKTIKTETTVTADISVNKEITDEANKAITGYLNVDTRDTTGE